MWSHFRLPALPLNIPPRVALKGFSGAVIAVLDGADHRVRSLILTFGTKKTTHRFDCRFVESVSVSTADVIRLPNQAGFGIRDGVC